MNEFDIKVIDALKEIINIGMGTASGAISDLINEKIELHVPEILFISKDVVNSEIKRELGDVGIYISQDFEGPLNGHAVLAYSKESSIILLNNIVKSKKIALNIGEIEISALQEIGNIVLSTVITSMADILNKKTVLKLPMVMTSLTEGYLQTTINRHVNTDQSILIKNTISNPQKSISGYILILVSFDEFNTMITELLHKTI